MGVGEHASETPVSFPRQMKSFSLKIWGPSAPWPADTQARRVPPRSAPCVVLEGAAFTGKEARENGRYSCVGQDPQCFGQGAPAGLGCVCVCACVHAYLHTCGLLWQQEAGARVSLCALSSGATTAPTA